MARRKKSGFQAFVDSISITNLMFHPGTLFVAFNVLIAIAAAFCWDRYRDKIVDHGAFALTPEKIVLNAPPTWAKTDIKKAILQSNGTAVSLLDPAILSDTAAILKTIGWVETIRRIEKSPDGLTMDLAYREPVAMVELHSNTVPGWKKQSRLIPVDRQGVVMPQSLASDDGLRPKIYLHHFDRKTGETPIHLRHVYRWKAWPDQRVADAASISELLLPHWQALGLSRIISWRQLNQADDRSVPFELWTEKGANAATVIWGNRPGAEIAGEAAAPQKIAALVAYLQKHGPLDQMEERIIDLRNGHAIEVGRTSALGYRRSFEVKKNR